MVATLKPMPTSIRLDPELKMRLEEIAAADGRSLSNLIDRALRAWIDIEVQAKFQGSRGKRR